MRVRCGSRSMRPVWLRALLVLGSVALLAAQPGPLRAQSSRPTRSPPPAQSPLPDRSPPVELHVNAFAGATNLPVWVAQREGLFARHGLNVILEKPNGSVGQFQGLAEGRYPIVISAFDNVVAYHAGQGSAEVGAIPDLVAVMGIDSGLLSLVATSGITRIADLKGRTLAVDAPTTGFSFALRDMLARAGVKESDVTFVAAGNSDGRWKALQEGRAQAALLTLPADLEAADHGARVLGTVAGSFGHYLGNVVAVRQGWGDAHRPELQSFLQAVRDAQRWLAARGNRARAIEILHAEMPALSEAQLARAYGALSNQSQGLIRDGAMNPAAAQTVLTLRRKYSATAVTIADVGEYRDDRYLANVP